MIRRLDLWTVHNLVAHPLAELLYLFGSDRWADWVHDVTIPAAHRRGRGPEARRG